MAIFVEEFLYRGREPGSAEPPAWHLQLTSLGTDDFGDPIRATRTLNMAQAEAAGWPLPQILSAINAEVMRAAEAARLRTEELEARLAEQEADLGRSAQRIAALEEQASARAESETITPG